MRFGTARGDDACPTSENVTPMQVSQGPDFNVISLPENKILRYLTTSAAVGDGEGIANVTGSAKKNETPAQKNAREFPLLPTLLKTFKDATDHRIIPYHFVIPRAIDSAVFPKLQVPTRVFGRVNDVHKISWPEQACGMNFGRVLDKFARNEAYQRSNPAVEILAALETYYEIHKHTLVPQEFEVPRGDATWSVATWGYNLGRRVETLRKNASDLTDSELADLKRVEFSFDFWETMWSDHILASLETYAHVHGNCRVLNAFEVHRADPWPRKAWGLSLGQVVTNIRSYEYYAAQAKRDMARLEAINFVWDDSEYQWSDRVLPSLEVFHQVHGHSLVPLTFVVPTESPWPEEAWGLELGISVHSIRSMDTFAKKTVRDAARLDAIDFVWDANEHKWSKMILPLLEAFARERGHCNVPQLFVVPSESPWPRQAWGLKLGVAASGVRWGGAYAKLVKRDKDRLLAIGLKVKRDTARAQSKIRAGRDIDAEATA